MGGAAAWENVDQTTGKPLATFLELTISTYVFEQAVSIYQGVLSTNADSER
jgi:hypothetical protein